MPRFKRQIDETAVWESIHIPAKVIMDHYNLIPGVCIKVLVALYWYCERNQRNPRISMSYKALADITGYDYAMLHETLTWLDEAHLLLYTPKQPPRGFEQALQCYIVLHRPRYSTLLKNRIHLQKRANILRQSEQRHRYHELQEKEHDHE